MMKEYEGMNCYTILMGEDDPDDRFIAEKAFLDLGCSVELRFVKDGDELMQYLRRMGKYSDPMLSPRPRLILLGLNMPKKNGREVLMEIKTDPDLEGIPVAIWTTSMDAEDKFQCKQMGADVFVTKPGDYKKLLGRIEKLISRYCFEGGKIHRI